MFIYLLITAEFIIVGVAIWYFFLRPKKVSRKHKHAVWGRYPDLELVRGDGATPVQMEQEP